LNQILFWSFVNIIFKIMSVNYLHITEHGGLEICNSAALSQNKLNGCLVYPYILAESFGFIEEFILKIIRSKSIHYLVISADPFCLPVKFARLFSLLPLPKGLILCDTHHGYRPVSRSLKFCIKANIQSVLLRFNQRHANIFRANGIWADATVLSPDLHQIALCKLSNLKRRSDPPAPESHIHFRRNSFGYQNIFSKIGLFVGSTERMHPFRSCQISLLRDKNIPFDVKSTPNAESMIDLLSTYEWGLNLPLNGDYNRRFIEILLADIPVLSERLPRSQCIFPFSLLHRHVISFNYMPGFREIKIQSPDNLSGGNALSLSPLHEILRLVGCGYDAAVLSSFDSSLRSDLSGRLNNGNNSIIADIELYDECLQCNINPLRISPLEARKLLSRAGRISTNLRLIPDDEFLRLSAYASA
jgi:hypothetical protein